MDDKYTAQKKYAKQNVKKVSCSFNKEFVDSFVEACHKLEITQASVIRKAMEETIAKAETKE